MEQLGWMTATSRSSRCLPPASAAESSESCLHPELPGHCRKVPLPALLLGWVFAGSHGHNESSRASVEVRVLLVSSSRYPDQWIVPGGGMEPEEEPGGAAVREVYEEAGVKGKLGRLLGIFENQDRKHRTYVYVLTVTEILEDWEDSVNIGRKREWFKVEDAIKVLQCHKPVHAEYLEKLKLSCSPTNGNSVVPPLPDNNSLYVTSAQTSGLPSTVR
uniref:diphosphoinositol-polyphosphate diphosphatase n=1 Tax=Meleagris gallopavo TaxID=9103 RepID=A0A803XP79_MELGA